MYFIMNLRKIESRSFVDKSERKGDGSIFQQGKRKHTPMPTQDGNW